MHQEAIKQTNLSSLPDLQLDNTKSNIVISWYPRFSSGSSMVVCPAIYVAFQGQIVKKDRQDQIY